MGPLGLIREDVSAEDVRRILAIESVDFAQVKARMNVDFPTSDEQLNRYEKEVKRFLALIVLDGSNGHVVGEKIDALWHYFVLHTREYAQFCHDVFGDFVHHVPVLPSEKYKLAAAYLRTRESYARYFAAPPKDLWGDNEQICWGGCDEFTSKKESQLH